MRPAAIAQADQARAYGADMAERALRRHPRVLDGGAVALDGLAPAPWFVAAIRRHNAIMESGGGLACVHVAGGVPGLRVVCIFKPGFTACGRCATRPDSPMFALDERANGTCDQCGEYDARGVHMTICRSGDTLIYYGLCVRDYRALLAEHGATPAGGGAP